MIKQEALECIKMLPDTADWDDVFYSLYVIQKVEKGRQEVRDGKGFTVSEAREQLGLS